MAEWTNCPSCNLKHSIRPDRLCPRCKTSIDSGGTAPIIGTGSTAPPLPPRPAIAPPPLIKPAPPAIAPRASVTRVDTSAAAGVACTYHPDVREDLVSCARCGRTFCSNCVVMLRGDFYCANCKEERVRDYQSGMPGERLRVMEAMQQGWRIVTEDIWPVWLLGFIYMLIAGAGNVAGAIPYVGILLSIPLTLFVYPQLQAGLVYAVKRKIDGAAADVGDLFEAFRQRYWSPFVIMLPVWGIGMVMGIVIVGGILLMMFITRPAAGSSAPRDPSILIVFLMLFAAPVVLFMITVLQAVMWFALVAMWDTHESGWMAFQAGWRVVFANLWPTVGLMMMFGLVSLGAALAGMIALCVGILFTMPFVMVWMAATFVLVYRSWRGQREALAVT